MSYFLFVPLRSFFLFYTGEALVGPISTGVCKNSTMLIQITTYKYEQLLYMYISPLGLNIKFNSLPTSFTIGNAQIPFKQFVKNLGFALDCHLTMNGHVSNISRTCYFALRRLASIRRFLASTVTATLYLLLFCHEVTTVAHCCLVLLMM